MDIKDYLHLYLGCEMRYTGNGLPFKGTSGNDILSIENFELLAFSNNRKLVLRPLSDMTDEEDHIANNQLRSTANEYLNEAETTRYLLSKGFDLFGLIGEGLAIDKTICDLKTLK